MIRARLPTLGAVVALALVIGPPVRGPATGIDTTTPIIGAKVSHSTSRLSTDAPISFDTVDFDGGGFFSPATPDRLTVTMAGCYFVEAQITILGWGYGRGGRMTRGNPASPDFLMEIKRNGDPIDYVAADNRTGEDAGAAQLGHTATVACFDVGDYIQLFVTPDRLVESNWPGSDEHISPVLLMVRLGAEP